MITSKQRSEIRALATDAPVLMQLGKDGITQSVLTQAEQLLFDHELVKINVLKNCPLTAKEVVCELSQKLQAEQVQAIGNKAVLFKMSDKNGIKHIYSLI